MFKRYMLEGITMSFLNVSRLAKPRHLEKAIASTMLTTMLLVWMMLSKNKSPEISELSELPVHLQQMIR